MKQPPPILKIAQYPQLALLAWSRKPDDEITAEEAFGLYENNWLFMDVERLNLEERELIVTLAQAFGNGLMFGIDVAEVMNNV